MFKNSTLASTHGPVLMWTHPCGARSCMKGTAAGCMGGRRQGCKAARGRVGGGQGGRGAWGRVARIFGAQQ